MPEKHTILRFGIVFLVFAVILLLRVPLLYEYHNFDEMQFLSWGKTFFERGPYSLDLMTPPIYSMILGVIYFLTGLNSVVFRLLITFILILNALLIALIGYRLHSRRCGVLAALIFLAYLGLPIFQGHYLTKELFENLFISLAVFLLTYERTQKNICLIGIIAGLGFVIRQTVFLQIAAIFTFLFFESYSLKMTTRVKNVMVFLLGLSIPFLIDILIGVAFNRIENLFSNYQVLIKYGTQGKGSMATGDYLGNLKRLSFQMPLLLPLISLASLGLIQSWRIRPKQALFMLMWTVGAVASMGFTGNFFPHYSQTLMVPLALLSGYALTILFPLGFQRKKWLFASISIILAFSFIWIGHPHLRDYILFVKKEITLREYWHRNNMADWSQIREGAFLLKEKMKPNERYFSFTSVPFDFLVLGPSILDRVVQDVEILPPESAYLSWKSFSYLFDYRRNQDKVLKSIESQSPPEWISVHISDRLPGFIFAFPEFFSKITAKYEFIADTGDQIIYKLKEEVKSVPTESIPLSLLVRSFRINSITFHPSTIDFQVSHMDRLDNKQVISYPFNSGNLLRGKKSRTIEFKNIFFEDDSEEIINHLKKLGLIVLNVDFYLRSALPEESHIIGQPDGIGRQLLITTVESDIRRIFVETPDSTYEGPGVLGRLAPIYHKEGWAPGIFLIDMRPAPYSPLYIYMVGYEEATVYIGYGRAKAKLENLIMRAFPESIRVKDDVIDVTWQNYLQDTTDKQHTYVPRISRDKILPENQWIPFSKLNKPLQRYIIESSGTTWRSLPIRFLKKGLLLGDVPKEIERCEIRTNGEIDYVGPGPDGIHRQLQWKSQNRILMFNRRQMIPGNKYELFVLFKDGTFLLETLNNS